MKRSSIIRYVVLGLLLLTVWITQNSAAMGEGYARSVYPVIAFCLSSFSHLLPFSLGDLFITLSIAGVILYPVYARYKKRAWKKIILQDAEYLLWIYVWFYLAWGLNYSQKNFYERTGTEHVAYTAQSFKAFAFEYVQTLNKAYTPPPVKVNKEMVAREVVSGYNRICDSIGLNRPFASSPKVKTMLFSRVSAAVGITGYMGPFFCEFNLNKNLLPVEYAATYAHELSHLLGITNEAEANFYAYEVCIRSSDPSIRFSGYFSILNHVLRNAKGVLSAEEYEELVKQIRPGVKKLAEDDYNHWMAMYSPIIGDAQDWIYDLYLKGNKIKSGRKNYSEVVGLLISWREKMNIQALRTIIIKNKYAH
ncbi:DUF3810 domain-containing protein [uncultured Bacteroides sp.]|uniref:DUF3810 domain-containing protein n=1 Tax=uncultured Bacteroides sp. TaxID=162156 RepID=UPI002AA6C8DE|nr:DUF3810 domain-containing protein [uncultured Bacteroides sp.]